MYMMFEVTCFALVNTVITYGNRIVLHVWNIKLKDWPVILWIYRQTRHKIL